MSAWYLAHDDELLLDLDGSPHAIDRFFRVRTRDAWRARKLCIRQVWCEPSATEGHYHVFVKLSAPMALMERMIWQSWIGSDLMRARADLMRARLGHPFPSLLILPTISVYRPPDRLCPCTEKHRTTIEAAKGDDACAVWNECRGPSPWECFGPPGDPGPAVPLVQGDITRRVLR